MADWENEGDDASTHMIEPSVIGDTFTTGIGKVESVCDECVRLTFCVREQGYNVVVEKIVLPRSALPELVAAVSAATDKKMKPLAARVN